MSDAQVRGEVGFFLAIACQLYQSRLNTLVATHDLSYSQVSLLNHLVGVGAPQSISAIADAMEINQPGVTKVVQRLNELGFVSIDVDPADSRRRLISVTPTVEEKLAEVTRTLAEDSEPWFSEWTANELSEFRDRLTQLVGWLDANRLA